MDIRRYGKVVKCLTEPRSYLVLAQNNKTYRRNRFHLIRALYVDEFNFNEELDFDRFPVENFDSGTPDVETDGESQDNYETASVLLKTEI